MQEKNDGIIPRVLEDFFSYDNGDADIYISFMEIYNEKVYDLLKNNNDIPLTLKGIFLYKRFIAFHYFTCL